MVAKFRQKFGGHHQWVWGLPDYSKYHPTCFLTALELTKTCVAIGTYWLCIVQRPRRLEVYHMRTTISAKTTEKLRTWFAPYGLPTTLVSEGVERAVQTTKRAFLKQLLQDEKSQEKQSIHHRIDSLLFSYLITPHLATGYKFKPVALIHALLLSSVAQ